MIPPSLLSTNKDNLSIQCLCPLGGSSTDGFAANLIIADGSIRAKLTGKGHLPQV